MASLLTVLRCPYTAEFIKAEPVTVTFTGAFTWTLNVDAREV